MSGGASLDWLFAVIGLSVGSGGAFLFFWSLYWDRARGRRRCPKCWYDMAGVPGLRCPECGREAASERKLLRTRRRWRWAVLATITIALGLACDRWPGYARGGWINAIPSWALMCIAPATAPNPGYRARIMPTVPGQLYGNPISATPQQEEPLSARLYAAAWSRIADGRMAGWEGRIYLWRCLHSDPDLNARSILRVPCRWPVGKRVPVAVSVSLPSAFGIEARFPGHEWEILGGGGAWRTYVLGQVSALAPPDTQRSALEYRITANGRNVYEGSMPTSLEVRGTPDDFLDPVDSEEASARVAAALRPRLMVYCGRPSVEHSIHADTGAWKPVDFGVFFTIEVRAGGRIVGRGVSQADWYMPVNGGTDHAYLKGPDGEALMRLEIDGQPLTGPMLAARGAELIIRGDSRRATEFFLAGPIAPPTPKFWAGTLVIPITEVEERGPAEKGGAP